jgi:hypothetical protein
MWIRLLTTCRAGVAVALAAAATSFVGAKPPELPADSKETATTADAKETRLVDPATLTAPELMELLRKKLGGKVQVVEIPERKLFVRSGSGYFDPAMLRVDDLTAGDTLCSLWHQLGHGSPMAVLHHKVYGDLHVFIANWPEPICQMPVEVEQIPVRPAELPPNRTFEEFLYETQHHNGTPERESSDASSPDDLAAARRMYRIGERCRRKGDLDMAYNCYQETLRLCPNSPYAPVACERAAEVAARKPAAAASGEEETDAPPPAAAAEEPSPESADARTMFVIGERCRRQGDVDMACNCYREAQLMAPDSSYGRLALKRLRQIGAGRLGDAAEKEPALPPKQEPGQPQAPVLFVPSLPRNLTIEVHQPESDGTPGSLHRPAANERPDAPVFDIDIEVASGRSGAGLRAEGVFRLGKLGYKMTYDDFDGHYRLVVVPSKP